jgi:predicted RNase H-like nuclease (RuvC/YqgF family)
MSVEAIIDDVMPLPPETLDSAELVGFLRRFSSMISYGENAENLQRAASLIEYLANRASETHTSLHQQQDTSSRYFEMCQALEVGVDTLSAENANLRMQLQQDIQQALSEQTRLREESSRLSAHVEQLEAALFVANAEIEELRNRPTAEAPSAGDEAVMVPVATLHAIRHQFEYLSNELTGHGGVVAQVMSEIGRCAVERVITEADAE